MATPLKGLSLLSSRLSPRNLSGLVATPLKNRTPTSRRLELPAPRTPFPTLQATSPGKGDVLIDTPQKSRICRDGLLEGRPCHVLGRGAFGKVVRATYKGRTVAMKLVRRPTPLRELNALSLSHGNVVRVLDVVRNEPGSYSMILMEYCPGSRSLQELLGSLAPDVVLGHSLGIASGLAYCHSRLVLHLDVKPANVLVCAGACKLADFGNSLDLRAVAPGDGFEHQGTALYSAPELVSGKFPTEKCDVYSLGITFWQMRSRRNPYEEFESKDEVLYKVVKYGLRPETDGPEDSYSALYRKCWDKDAGNRPTARQVLQMLQDQSKC